jgi:hypothetical protein
MSSDRSAVLQLVALGRMTAADAERLLAVWGAERENHWMVFACMAMATVATLHSLLHGSWPAAWQFLYQVWGGMQ